MSSTSDATSGSADAVQKATEDGTKQLELLNSVRSVQTQTDLIISLTSKKYEQLEKVANMIGRSS